MNEKTTEEDTEGTERGIDSLSDPEELTEYGEINQEKETKRVGEEWELGWHDKIPEEALESGNEQVINDTRLFTG